MQVIGILEDVAAIPPWEAVPTGLVTLHEVLQFAADQFVQIGNILREMEGHFMVSENEDGEAYPADISRIAWCLRNLSMVCGMYGMRSASKKCQRILDRTGSDNPISIREWHSSLRDLRERIEDDLESQYFLHLEHKEAKLYLQPLEGWEDVFPRFPKVCYNIQESSKCFALERYGAACFMSFW
jgi:hypothetical protein